MASVSLSFAAPFDFTLYGSLTFAKLNDLVFDASLSVTDEEVEGTLDLQAGQPIQLPAVSDVYVEGPACISRCTCGNLLSRGEYNKSMATLWNDIRYGLRLLRHSPGFTAVAAGALALGIGANTAIFSTLDAVLLRPLPFADPDRVVMVWEDASIASFPRNTPAPANFFDWKARNHFFSDMAATRGASANLTIDGPPEQVVGRRATANFFDVLGVKPIAGRTFTEGEDRDGAPVCVISYALWQRRYNGEAGAVNRDILIDGARYSIIGVMPRDFAFRNRNMDFWIPIHFSPNDKAARGSHLPECGGAAQARRHGGAGARRHERDRAPTGSRVSR